MTKFAGYSFLLFCVIAPFIGSNTFPHWWTNPHNALFGVNQNKLYSSNKSVKPDLAKFRGTVYTPFRVSMPDGTYSGMITVRADDKNQIKIGGGVYLNKQTESLGLLEGELIDKNTHYEIKFTAKNASKLFESKTKYQNHTDFPLTLELRVNPADNRPYIVGPTETAERNRVQFYPIQGDPEKAFIGKWKTYDRSGEWKFTFANLSNHQLNGTGVFTEGDRTCSYGMLAIPGINGAMIFMTGESTEKREDCEVLSWIGYANQYDLSFDFLNTENMSVTLTKAD